MYKGKTFLALVPARGGSKGIPNKNIKKICGKPLIAYTIEEANNSKYIDKVIVSTDSEAIRDSSIEHGAEVPFLRPIELASDEAKTIDVVLHSVDFLANSDLHFDYIILLQPTQPLRKFWHIDEAIERIVDKKAENLVSLSVVKDHPLLVRSIDHEGEVIKLIDEGSTVRRQDFPSFYKVNGAIYINKINDHLNSETSLNDNKLSYIMDAEFDLDIDEDIDLQLFEFILHNRDNKI